MIKKTDVKLASSGSVAFNFDRKVRAAFRMQIAPEHSKRSHHPPHQQPNVGRPTNQCHHIRACWRWWGRWRRTK